MEEMQWFKCSSCSGKYFTTEDKLSPDFECISMYCFGTMHPIKKENTNGRTVNKGSCEEH